jgi:hypothetical protein
VTTDLQGLLGQLAGAISLLGFVPYIIAIAQGKTRPNRATWWIWSVVGAMLCASYYASGTRHALWVPLSYVIGPLATALLALKYGEGGWDRFDRTCLAASLLSLVVWWLARSPLVALLANLGIDLLGAVPTIRKAYRAPEAESLLSWLVFLLADTLNVCAIGTWSLATALYPVYLFILAAVLVTLLMRPRVTPLSMHAPSRQHPPTARYDVVSYYGRRAEARSGLSLILYRSLPSEVSCVSNDHRDACRREQAEAE